MQVEHPKRNKRVFKITGNNQQPQIGINNHWSLMSLYINYINFPISEKGKQMNAKQDPLVWCIKKHTLTSEIHTTSEQSVGKRVYKEMDPKGKLV